MDTVFLLVLLPGLFDPVPDECNKIQKIRKDGRTFIRRNMTLGLESGTWSSVPEGEYLHLECPWGSAIRVLEADYGRDSIFCSARSSFDILHQRCHGKRKCSIPALNSEFGDPCRGYNKVLKVKYTCDKVSGEWRRSETACEREELSLACPGGTQLVVEDAFYGRRDGASCADPGDRNENTRCSSRRALPVVRDRCHLKPNCSVLASNDIFGDPCPHIRKYLKVEYKCAAVFWDIEGRKSATICPKCSGKISCPSGKRIVIANVWFPREYSTGLSSCAEKSKPHCGSSKILDSVSKSCNNKEECVPLSHEDTVEDDCVWPQKDLEVEFDCVDGVEEPTTDSDEAYPRPERSADGLQEETVCETHKKTISCAEGAVIRVEEAEYGRRDRTICPHYQMADVRCQANNSFSVLSQACNGKQTCTLYSSNSVFGDPCLGTYKYLTVKYSCTTDTLEVPLRVDRIEQVCEGSSRPISCPEDHVISIKSAVYGRNDSKPCPGQKTYVTNCGADSAFSLVSERCNGFKTCLLESKNTLYGDPCVGTTKYLEVDYDCKRGTLEVPLKVDRTEQVCEGSSRSISCPEDHVISIKSAVYGRNDSKPCPGQKTYVTNCGADSAFSLVSERCNGFKTCLLESKNTLYGDPCVGTTKYLEVDYDCKRGTLEVPLKVDRTEQVCEGSSRSISCPEDHVISIKSAVYGRNDSKPCPGQKTYVTNCGADSAFSLVSERCNGTLTCLLESTNLLYGDPCVGTTKYLEVDYDCMRGVKDISKPHYMEVQKVKIDEHQGGTLQCPGGSIQIVDAAYGKDSCRAESSFRIVSTQCNHKESCVVYAKNEIFGDPCVGTIKQLIVTYQCKTVNPDVRNVVTAEEHKSALLECPEGTAILIHSGSYGQVRQRGNDAVHCSSDTAFSTVSNICNLQRKCIVNTTNDVFSDPCPGIKKELKVKYECVQVMQYHYKEIEEGQSSTLSCPKGSSILVSGAVYGLPTGPRHDPLSSVACAAERSSNVVSARCNYMTSCHLFSSNSVFGDPCWGDTKTLLIEYRCIKDQVNRGRVCEHSTLEMDCPDDTRINVVSARYGRAHPYVCSSSYRHSRGCASEYSTAIVYRTCQGKSYCTVPATNRVFEDPCRGIEKYLEVEYECVGTYSVDSNPVESILPENSLRNVSFYLKNINECDSVKFLAQIKKSSEKEWKTVLFGRDFREVQTIVGLEPDASYDLRVLHKDQTSDLTCHSSVTVSTWPWIDIK